MKEIGEDVLEKQSIILRTNPTSSPIRVAPGLKESVRKLLTWQGRPNVRDREVDFNNIKG